MNNIYIFGDNISRNKLKGYYNKVKIMGKNVKLHNYPNSRREN